MEPSAKVKWVLVDSIVILRATRVMLENDELHWCHNSILS